MGNVLVKYRCIKALYRTNLRKQLSSFCLLLYSLVCFFITPSSIFCFRYFMFLSFPSACSKKDTFAGRCASWSSQHKMHLCENSFHITVWLATCSQWDSNNSFEQWHQTSSLRNCIKSGCVEKCWCYTKARWQDGMIYPCLCFVPHQIVKQFNSTDNHASVVSLFRALSNFTKYKYTYI